jgi:hypothetical protein
MPVATTQSTVSGTARDVSERVPYALVARRNLVGLSFDGHLSEIDHDSSPHVCVSAPPTLAAVCIVQPVGDMVNGSAERRRSVINRQCGKDKDESKEPGPVAEGSGLPEINQRVATRSRRERSGRGNDSAHGHSAKRCTSLTRMPARGCRV